MKTVSKCPACGYDHSLRVVRSWTIDLDIPAVSLNEIGSNSRGRSGYRYRRHRDKLEEALRLYDIPETRSVRRVWFWRYYRPGKRDFDKMNLAGGFKPLQDLLQKRGWIRNDSPRWLIAYYKQALDITGGDRTVIIIEDVEKE